MRRTEPAPLLVFDLDGTLLRVNTFPRWALYLMLGRLPGLGLHRRVRLSLHTARLVLVRKLGRISHEELQRRLQSASAQYAAVIAEHFCPPLQRYVRPNLRPILEMVRERQVDAILATAACADYAEFLGCQFGFQHVVATRSERNAGQPSNSGDEKRRQVHNIRDAMDWSDRPLILFTDHIDDLPLMRDSRMVCWFGPPQALPAVRALADGVRFHDCREMTDDALRAVLDTVSNPASQEPVSAMTLS